MDTTEWVTRDDGPYSGAGKWDHPFVLFAFAFSHWRFAGDG